MTNYKIGLVALFKKRKSHSEKGNHYASRRAVVQGKRNRIGEFKEDCERAPQFPREKVRVNVQGITQGPYLKKSKTLATLDTEPRGRRTRAVLRS